MKITYEEFNELQRQQMIRDYASEASYVLYNLSNIVGKEHNKKISEIGKQLYVIRDEAIENIRKMVEENDW